MIIWSSCLSAGTWKKTAHLCTNCNFLSFVRIKKTIQCLLTSEVIQFDIMLHVAPKGKSFHSARQPSITVFSVKWSDAALGSTWVLLNLKKWFFFEKVEIKSSSLKQSGAKLNGSNTRQASVFRVVIMCVLEHYLTIDERATGHAIRTVLVAFLFVFCTHCHRRCRPTSNINHRQHQRYLSFTASSLYIWTTAVPFFLVWCTNPSMTMNRFRTLQPGSQSKPFLSQHHCLFLEVCIESKILQYSFEAVDVLALQCVVSLSLSLM